MFEQIKNIAVDRKNSLPIADLRSRYRSTATPVIFGDLTKRWRANDKWSIDYFSSRISDLQVPLYSNHSNDRHPSKPVMYSNLKHYFDDLIHNGEDLRVSNLPYSKLSSLSGDFSYPRLGFNFKDDLTTFCFGGAGVTEPMRQASKIVHSVHCHFGHPASVLLIPPSQTPFIYKVSGRNAVVSSIDFNRPHFGKFPALKKLSGYVADLSHGDALYIPAGFWYCTVYKGPGIKLSFKERSGSLLQFAAVVSRSILHRLKKPFSTSDTSLKRRELRVHRKINTKFQD